MAEVIGDITLHCTGGTPTAAGAQVPTSTITLTLENADVTSRLLGTSPTGNNPSEALLLIDDPAPQNQKVLDTTTPILGTGAGVDFKAVGNVIQGVQNKRNQVVWTGVPIDPPNTSSNRIFRITNIRANANGVTAGASGKQPVIARISGLPAANNAVVAGYLSLSLKAYLHSLPVTVSGCSGASETPPQESVILRFSPLDVSYFKPRATTDASGSLLPQNDPGVAYNTESGFYNPTLFKNATLQPGLSDWGTRLKAVFNNIPNGVSIFVSTNDLKSGSIPNAVLTSSENGPFSAVPSTGTARISGTGYALSQLTVEKGSATAFWEILRPEFSPSKPVDFGVLFSVPAGTSPTGAAPMTATLSYAPAFGGYPRFSETNAQAIPIFAASDCSVTSPTLGTSATALNLTGTAGSVTPNVQSVTLTSNGASIQFTVSASTAAGGNWLSVTPSSTTTPATLQVSSSAAGLPAGNYSGTILVGGGPTPMTIPVDLKLSGATPSFPSDGVVNAATQKSGPIAPGEIITIYGTALGPTAPVGLTIVSGKVFNEIGNTQVLFDGVPAPIIYSSASQLSAVVPYGVVGRSATPVQVFNNGILSPPVSLLVTPASPGIFTLNSSGTGPGAILNQNFTVNGPSNPAATGSVVTFFVTGEGQTNPAGQDGAVTAEPFPKPLLPVSVTIGGMPAQTAYTGEAPGLVSGVLQVNAVVPTGLPSGPATVVVTVGSNSSPSGVTVQVQ